MTLKDFLNLTDTYIEEVLFLFTKKSKHYATTEDIFSNFKKASQLLNLTPEEVILSYMSKHYVSLCDIIRNKKDLTTIDEKVMDLINYLLLLRAYVKDTILREEQDGNQIRET